MIHSDEKPYKCKICKKSFRHKQHLNRHLRIHSDVKPYKGQVCEKSFRQSSHLNRHLRIHSGDKQHKSKFCDEAIYKESISDNPSRTQRGVKKVCKESDKERRKRAADSGSTSALIDPSKANKGLTVSHLLSLMI